MSLQTPTKHPSTNSLFEKITEIVGSNNVLTGTDVISRSVSWSEEDPCLALAIIRPSSTDEVSQIMRMCHEVGQHVVVHGGRTGLVGGVIAQPDDIVISLERMNQIDEVDLANRTVCVGAGATLEVVQNVATDADLHFALDLGARGTATIGGAVATNAGRLKRCSFRYDA